MKHIYKRVDEILSSNIEFNKNAMISMQALGFNGFKRMHRVLSKNYLCLQIELANDLFDKYRAKEGFANTPITYCPSTMREHLATWDSRLEADLKALGELNKEHFNMIGITNSVIEKAISCLRHKHVKVYRWYKRFEETTWSAHDMHTVDQYLHDKYKSIEG